MDKIKKPASIISYTYVADYQGCGHIRVIFPSLFLNNHRIEGYTFISSYGSHFIHDNSFYKSLTYLQFQRAATTQHYNIIKHYMVNVKPIAKTPLVYEIDDLLFDVPEWNRASSYYKAYEDSIKKIMSTVDGMIVSTNKLKEVYGEYCKNINIIPNHLVKFLWGGVMEPDFTNKKIRILYQGSDNHFATKALAKEGVSGGDFDYKLMDFIRKTSNDYTWVFMGGYPLELEDLKNSGKIEYHGWKNIFEYPSYVKKLKPDICLAPLSKNLFNECKCLIGNTYVTTDSGIKMIRDVKVGDKVCQKNEFKDVLSTVKYEKVKTLMLTTKLGYCIEGTPNHRLISEERYRTLSDIKVGDKILVSSFEYPEIERQKIDGIVVDKIWSTMLGVLFGYENSPYSDIKNKSLNNLINYFCWDKGIKEDYLFNLINDDVLNNVILKSPGDIIRTFLRGVFESSVLFKNQFKYQSNNYEFIRLLQYLLLGFRTITVFRSKWDLFIIKPDVSRNLFNNMYYSVFSNEYEVDDYYMEANFDSVYQKKVMKKYSKVLYHNEKALINQTRNDYVTSIIESENDVYDIQVPENKCYIANGFVSHNSNIKNLEYVALGGSAIYTDIEPYKHCNIKVNSSDEMIDKIEKLAKDEQMRYDTWKIDYDKVKEQLFWEEHGNVNKYINSYLNLFGKELE